MREADPVRVQEHPLQPLLRELLVPREVAVLVVAGERKAEVREMHADLVRAPGFELGFEERERRVVRPATSTRGGRSCARRARRGSTRTRRSPSPVTPRLQRQLHAAHARRAICRAPARSSACRPARRAAARAAPSARRASSRPAARPTCRGRAGGRARGTARPGARARSRSITPKRDAAAAVHREPGRLVERDQRVVLVQDRRSWRASRGSAVGRRAAGAAVRIGGIRSSSPAASRASGPTRARLTRTSPLRRIR